MMIGSFQTAGDGYAGSIRTLLLDAMIAIVPAAPSDAENAPGWRVLLVEADDGLEIGAGWDRSGERAERAEGRIAQPFAWGAGRDHRR